MSPLAPPVLVCAEAVPAATSIADRLADAGRAAAALDGVDALVERVAAEPGGWTAPLVLVQPMRGRDPAFLVGKMAALAPLAAILVLVARDDEALGVALAGGDAADYAFVDADGAALRAALADAEAAHRIRRRLSQRGTDLRVSQPQRWDWLWESGPDLRLSWLSPGFAAAAGLDAQAVLGCTLEELDCIDREPAQWVRPGQDMAARRPLRGVVCRYRDGGGRLRTVRLSGAPVRDGDGTFRGYAGGASDLSAEAEASARLALAHEKLMDTNADLAAYRARVAGDLEAAAAMQREVLPTHDDLEVLRDSYGIALSAHFESSSELGGDLWGARWLDSRRFALWLADFSGHGVTAALNTFRLQTLFGDMDTDILADPTRCLDRLNTRLTALLPSGHYATMLYAVVDVDGDCLRYAAAAPPPPLLAAPGGGGVVALDSRGAPLGLFPGVSHDTREVVFSPGASLFLYSDALEECGREKGLALGRSGVAALVRDVVRDAARAGRPPAIEAVITPFAERIGRPLSDDLTAVCCRRLERS